MSNPQNRFEARRVAVDDGWCSADADDASAEPAPETEVFEETARSLITSNDSPDVPFRRSMNPYRGCEHGCIYCYARPNHGYLGLSPGLDFESKIFVKVNAAERLRREISAKDYRCEAIALGTATDAYQPVERRYRLTRSLVEILSDCRHPFSVLTKSALVERDIDLIAPMAREGLAAVSVTLTTLDPELARCWEPRAAAPWRRLQTMRRLHEAGIPVGVSVAPIAPFLNEPELERVLAAAREAGASTAFYSTLRLPHELRELFVQWLAEHYPHRARRVLHRLHDMRLRGTRTSRVQAAHRDAGAGADRADRMATRFSGEGPWAELLRLRFDMALRRLGYERDRPALRTELFRAPPRDPAEGGRGGRDDAQLGLF